MTCEEWKQARHLAREIETVLVEMGVSVEALHNPVQEDQKNIQDDRGTLQRKNARFF